MDEAKRLNPFEVREVLQAEGREEEFLGIFIEKTLAAVKQQNGL